MANSSLWNQAAHSSSQNKTTQTCAPYSIVALNTEKWLMITGYIIQFLLSIVGNALVVGVFWKWRSRFKSPVDSFIVNMAASDLLIPFCVIPRRVQDIYLGSGPWLVDGALGNILCKVANFADEISVTVSSQSIVFIAAERFWAIVYPLKKPIISRKNSPKWICFTWIFSALCYSFYFFAYKLIRYRNFDICAYSLPDLFDTWEDLWKVDRMLLFVVFGVIPFILITIFYTTIAVTLYRRKLTAFRMQSKAERKRVKEKQRIIVMILLIIILFFVSWIPHYVYIFKHHFFKHVKWPCNSVRKLYVFVKFVNYIYTVFNPIIYYLFNQNYRKSFNKVFCSFTSCFRSVLVPCKQFLPRCSMKVTTVLPDETTPNVICLSITSLTEK